MLKKIRQPTFIQKFDSFDHRWWVLAVVDIGILMATIDASIVNIALPTILTALHTTLAATEWVLEAYILTITALLLAFGRIADMIGRSKVYTLGFAVFTAGSVLCGLSQNVEQLIAFRVFQAVGAAMILANGFAIVTTVFPPQQRGMALGINGTVVATGFTIGPTLGGLLIHLFDWRSIFFVNLPIGIIGTLAAAAFLRERRAAERRPEEKPRFDIWGAVISTAALLSLLLALNIGPDVGWASLQVLGLLALFIVLAGLWVVVESRVRQPLVDLALFRRRTFTAGNLAGLLSFLAISANAFLMPFYLQLVLGYSPVEAGLMMTPTALVMAVVAPVSGWLSDRLLGARILSSIGLGINATALLMLGTLTAQAHYSQVLRWLLLLGLGQGLFQSPNNSSVMGDVPRERLGIGSGLLAMVRNVGQVVGIAVSASFLLSSLSAVPGQSGLGILESAGGSGANSALVSAFISGLHLAYWTAAGFAAIGIAVSLIRGGRPRALAEVTTIPEREQRTAAER